MQFSLIIFFFLWFTTCNNSRTINFRWNKRPIWPIPHTVHAVAANYIFNCKCTVTAHITARRIHFMENQIQTIFSMAFMFWSFIVARIFLIDGSGDGDGDGVDWLQVDGPHRIYRSHNFFLFFLQNSCSCAYKLYNIISTFSQRSIIQMRNKQKFVIYFDFSALSLTVHSFVHIRCVEHLDTQKNKEENNKYKYKQSNKKSLFFVFFFFLKCH